MHASIRGHEVFAVDPVLFRLCTSGHQEELFKSLVITPITQNRLQVCFFIIEETTAHPPICHHTQAVAITTKVP